MHELLGVRLLRWFAGDLQNRRKQLAPIFNDENLETKVGMAVGQDSPASTEDHGNKLSVDNDFITKRN